MATESAESSQRESWWPDVAYASARLFDAFLSDHRLELALATLSISSEHADREKVTLRSAVSEHEHDRPVERWIALKAGNSAWPDLL